MIDDTELPVAVVVVTYNSAPVLEGLVASLDPGFGEVPWCLVVADNASSDDSVERVRQLVPEALVVEMQENRGYAAGINAAVGAAPAHRAVLVLNPDVRLGPGCVPVLLERLAQPGVGIVVPRLLDAHGELILSMRRAPSIGRALGDALVGTTRAGRFDRFGEMVSDPDRYDRASSPDWAEGSTQLVGADCWRTCGPWDESFFLYSEETDFNLRVRDAGFDIAYEPGATAQHLEGGSATSARLWPLLVANRLTLFRRRHGVVRTVPYWVVLAAREGSRALLGRATSRAALRVLTSPRRLRQVRGPAWLDG